MGYHWEKTQSPYAKTFVHELKNLLLPFCMHSKHAGNEQNNQTSKFFSKDIPVIYITKDIAQDKGMMSMKRVWSKIVNHENSHVHDK